MISLVHPARAATRIRGRLILGQALNDASLVCAWTREFCHAVHRCPRNAYALPGSLVGEQSAPSTPRWRQPPQTRRFG
jgi:hypothetical protein